MKKLLLTGFALVSFMTQAQHRDFELEGRLGVLGTNYITATNGDKNYTDAEFAIHAGASMLFPLTDLFTVQGDTATLKGVISVDAYLGPESGQVKFLPSGGFRLDFPLYIEYGMVSTFYQLRSYFNSGINITDNFGIYTRLLNFNPYVNGDLISYSEYHQSEIKLKRTIAFGIKYKF